MKKIIKLTAVIAGLTGIAQAAYVETYDTFNLGELTAQQNWAANTAVTVVATTTSGNYTGGQALLTTASNDKTLTGTNLTFGLAGGTNVIEYGFDFNTTNTTAVVTKMRLAIVSAAGAESVPSPSFGLTNGWVNIRVAGETGTDYITGNNLGGGAYYSTNPVSGQWAKGDWIRFSLQLTGEAGSKFTNATITAYNLSRGWSIATGVTDVDLSGYAIFNTTNAFNAIRIRNTTGGVSIDNAYVQSFKSSLNFGAASNTVPYQETFEEMAVGSPVVVFNNTNGWYSGTNTGSAFVTNVSYELNNLLHPVESATHSNVLKFTETSLINRIQPYSAANTTVDFMLQSALGEINPDDSLVPGSQTALYLDADGQLKVWYGLDTTGTNNAWQTFANTPVGTSDWARITIAFDYTTDPSKKVFKILLNGAELQPPTNGYMKGIGTFTAASNGIWLLSAIQTNAIKSFSAGGDGMLDDLVITTNDVVFSANYLLTGSAGANGTVAPTNASVPAGGSTNFVITANPYYRILKVTTTAGYTNDSYSNSSTSATYTWTNVQATGTLTATFTNQVANDPAGTPYTWLASYGLTNGGATFDEAAAADQDSDGLKAWQEYIANTVPTNAASVLKVSQTPRNVVIWSAQPNRIYSVHWSTNLVKGFTNLNNNATSPYTNTSPDAKVNHYQVRVRLP